MDFDDPAERRVFFDVHRGLPREGPGNRASTLRALAYLTGARAMEPRWIVDVGCGPGMQSLDLATALPAARVLAVDLHVPFLGALAGRARDADAGERILPVCADMVRLPVADAAADLVWCEGAAYIMGVPAALDAWWRLLRPGGACAFTEAVWLKQVQAPARVRACWAEYPAMGDVAATRDLIRGRGFELLGDFLLPPEAWWDDYYGPMQLRLEALDAHYHEDPIALAVLAECREEIDVYRQYGDWYGYAFFVAIKP